MSNGLTIGENDRKTFGEDLKKLLHGAADGLVDGYEECIGELETELVRLRRERETLAAAVQAHSEYDKAEIAWRNNPDPEDMGPDRTMMAAYGKLQEVWPKALALLEGGGAE